MSLIYITGISGSGKSTVKAELVNRGYLALDVDEDGFKSWYNKKDGSRATDQKTWEEAEADYEWRQRYWLKAEPDKVKELAERAKSEPRPVFLTGTTPNDQDIWPYFDKVIHLSVDDKTLTSRLLTRTNNSFGKDPKDLKDILGWNKDADARNKAYGAVLVDASKPIDEVVNEVLSKSLQ